MTTLKHCSAKDACESVEVWKCSKCLGLSDDLYEQLVTSSKSNLHWFCEKCEEDVLDPAVSNDKIISLLESLQMKSDSFQLQLLTNLAEMEQKMLEKVNSVEDQIFVKVESAVDEKLKKFEEKSVDKAYSVEQTFLRQESRAAARKPRDAASVLFGRSSPTTLLTSIRLAMLRKPRFRAPNMLAQNTI